MPYNKYLNPMTEKEYLEEKNIRIIEENFKSVDMSKPNRRGIFRISLTEDCNFNCYFCHNEGMEGTKRQFDLKLLSNIIEAYRDYIKEIKLVGGEPLLHTQFNKAVDMCRDVAPVSVTTNGSLIPKWLDALSYMKNITVSVHSLHDDIYSKIMGTRSKPSVVIDNIRKLIDMGKRIHINCVVTTYNKDEAISLAETFADMGVEEIKFLSLLKVKESDMDTYVPLKYISEKLEERYGKPIEVRGVKISYAINSKSKATLLYQYCSVGCNICRVDGYLRLSPEPSISYCLAAEPISIAEEAVRNDRKGLLKKLHMAEERKGHPTGYSYVVAQRRQEDNGISDTANLSELQG